jgi:hypothetical protein
VCVGYDAKDLIRLHWVLPLDGDDVVSERRGDRCDAGVVQCLGWVVENL